MNKLKPNKKYYYKRINSFFKLKSVKKLDNGKIKLLVLFKKLRYDITPNYSTELIFDNEEEINYLVNHGIIIEK